MPIFPQCINAKKKAKKGSKYQNSGVVSILCIYDRNHSGMHFCSMILQLGWVPSEMANSNRPGDEPRPGL